MKVKETPTKGHGGRGMDHATVECYVEHNATGVSWSEEPYVVGIVARLIEHLVESGSMDADQLVAIVGSWPIELVEEQEGE